MALRFNSPPGWPAPPVGWAPAPGWRPDPSWPPVPPGWPLWVDDRPPAGPASTARALVAANWAFAGAVLVLVGSFMPFVNTSFLTLYEVDPDVKGASAVFGVVLGALALAMRPRGSRVVSSVLVLAGGALGALGYGGFAYMGIHGFEAESDFGGYPTYVEFSPGAGIVACLVGSVIATVAAIAALKEGNRG
jgi:hypothetical protein